MTSYERQCFSKHPCCSVDASPRYSWHKNTSPSCAQPGSGTETSRCHRCRARYERPSRGCCRGLATLGRRSASLCCKEQIQHLHSVSNVRQELQLPVHAILIRESAKSLNQYLTNQPRCNLTRIAFAACWHRGHTRLNNQAERLPMVLAECLTLGRCRQTTDQVIRHDASCFAHSLCALATNLGSASLPVRMPLTSKSRCTSLHDFHIVAAGMQLLYQSGVLSHLPERAG